MNIVVGIFALLIGVGSIWFSLKFIRLYLKVKRWEKIPATVVSKEIALHKKHSSSRTPYKVSASYNFIYNDKMYTGHFVYLADLAGGQVNHMKSDAENRLEKIKENIQVFVNPNEPNESVIYCEGVGLYLFVFFMGSFAVLFGIAKML